MIASKTTHFLLRVVSSQNVVLLAEFHALFDFISTNLSINLSILSSFAKEIIGLTGYFAYVLPSNTNYINYLDCKQKSCLMFSVR